MKTSEITNFHIEDANKKIHILIPHFNENYGEIVLKSCLEELKKQNCTDVKVSKVFGALELPYAAQTIIKNENPDAIIALA